MTNKPLGTGFTVTPHLMITANHVRFNDDGSEIEKLSAVKTLVKNGEGVTAQGETLKLKVVLFDKAEDWCILTCVDRTLRFSHEAAIGTTEDDLPEEGAPHNAVLTIRYFNGGLFKNKLIVKRKAVVFDQFQGCDDLQHENEAELQVNGGSTSGMCGAPYFYCHKVIGFHVESDSESLKFGDTHEHFSVGRVLCRLPRFMVAFKNSFDPSKYNLELERTAVNVKTVRTIAAAKEMSAASMKRKRAEMEKGLQDEQVSASKRKKET